ncbi:Uncharacterised protein [Mycobacteroides abscessus subsp. abscessus]|nr:Uncharacterised protein [Mycobacteroides abscessus subsp. abscessus]
MEGPHLRPAHRDPHRQGLRGPRQVQEPVRPRADVLDRLRRRLPVHPAQARRDRIRLVEGALRVVHARDPVRELPWHPAQARSPGCEDRGPLDRRGRRARPRRSGRLPLRSRTQRPRRRRGRAGDEGDQRPPRLPPRRRSRIPQPQPGGGHALGRRGAADPARHTDRVRARRRPLRPRRTLDRPPPARQPAPHRHAHQAQGPRQHPHRRRTR